MKIGNWVGIRFATTFRNRHGRTRPALGQQPPRYKTLHTGKKRWRADRSRTLWFLIHVRLGMVGIAGGFIYHNAPDLTGLWAIPVALATACLWGSVKAFESRHWVAGVLNLAYPFWLALRFF